MPKVQFRLTLAVLFTALALLAIFGTNLISGPIDGLYRNAAGLSSARNVAQIAALAAAGALFVAGLIITISAALQPARWFLKPIYVIPVYLLGLALVSVISGLLGVGVLGNFLNLQGIGAINFAAAFVAVGAGTGYAGAGNRHRPRQIERQDAARGFTDYSAGESHQRDCGGGDGGERRHCGD